MEAFLEPQVDLQYMDKSCSLRDFAVQEQVTEERVWEMIEEGQLSARFINDTILIFRDSPGRSLAAAPEPSREPQVEESSWVDCGSDIQASQSPVSLPSFHREEKAPSAPALSLKEESLSASSLKRALELSEELLEAKELILRLKDEKIQQLEKQILGTEQEVKKLRREVENYQTLCKVSNNPQLLRTLIE